MKIEIFRCQSCGREVLVRHSGAISKTEIFRRQQQEFEPLKTGPAARPDPGSKLRDDIWIGVSQMREPVPREELPEICPACARSNWTSMRILD